MNTVLSSVEILLMFRFNPQILDNHFVVTTCNLMVGVRFNVYVREHMTFMNNYVSSFETRYFIIHY